MSKSTTYGSMILAAAVWGFQPSCIKWLMQVWTPVTVSAVRYFIFGIILILWSYRKEGRAALPNATQLPWLVGMGICGVMLNNILQFTGLQYTTITNCTLISSTTPCLTAIASFCVLRERLALRAWGGIVLSLVGVLLVVSNGSWDVISRIDFNKGDVMCFGSQVAWTAYTLFSMKLMKTLPTVAITGWAGLIGSLFNFAYGLSTNQLHVTALSNMQLVSFLYVIFLGGIFAMVTWNQGVKVVGPSVASIFLNIMPVVGMVAGFFLFNEPMGFPQLMGAVTIFVGVYLVTR